MPMHSFAWWPTLIAVVIATVTDLRSRRIPNWLVLPFLLVGVVVSAWIHGWRGMGQSAEGFGLGLLIFGFLFLMGGMGAGDVKLFAAIGAWVGPMQLFIALILTSLAGGILVLVWAICGGFLGDLFQGTSDLALGRKKRKEGLTKGRTFSEDENSQPVKRSAMQHKIPYAPAIAIGTLLSFFAR